MVEAESYCDAVLARIKHDVRLIATGYKLNHAGRKQRTTRDEQRDIARKLCVDMGWPFKWEGGHVVP